MLRLDHFTSIFRAADKPVPTFQKHDFKRVFVVSDLEGAELEDYWNSCRALLGEIEHVEFCSGEDAKDVQHVHQRIEASSCDLILTHRCVHSKAWRFPYSIGSMVEVLTQICTQAVLLMPHPSLKKEYQRVPKNVLLLSGDLTKAEPLMDVAWGCTAKDGEITLVQLEDIVALERIFSVIEKIPQIDTDVACQEIAERLSHDNEHLAQCFMEHLQQQQGPKVSYVFAKDQSMRYCRRLCEETACDLLVLSTKDDDQLAIHGLAYPLMVELRTLPMLLC